MKILALGLGRIVEVAVAVAAVSALAGFLIAHFGGYGTSAAGAGWGMCVGGALMVLVTGQSGSPTEMAAGGRWGSFGQYWSRNPALPQSPLWTIASAILVCAAGIAVIVLSY